MSAAFTLAGFFLGFMAAHISGAEPLWALLLVPAAAAFIAGCFFEWELRS